MSILVTGGAGYIGSHTVVQLLDAGHDVVVVDNFSNSRPSVLDRIDLVTGRRPILVEQDVRDVTKLKELLHVHGVTAVIHFAGLKAVGESVEEPLAYYLNNVYGTLALVTAMRDSGTRNLVFSSSATVYGDPDSVPIPETAALRVTNPYGRTKLMCEQILGDVAAAETSWSMTLLRYFNPVGAHESGLLGEDPAGIPNNLVPYIAQVAVGRRDHLRIFGEDYPTRDGTGVRDYIDVNDLAAGHLAALDYAAGHTGTHVFNLGTGTGTSVLEMVAAFQEASGREIPYEVVPRRPGDVAECYADASRARELLGWSAARTVGDMAASSWRWQSGNPAGYP